MRLIFFIFLLLRASLVFSDPGKELHWPEVSKISASFLVSNESPHVKMDILSVEGMSLYTVECHRGDLDKNYPRTGDYQGFFQCKIIPEYEDVIDLFIPGGGWNGRLTRATFRTGWGDGCEDHEYYGLNRVFHFRGMEVVLSMSSIDYRPSIKEMRQRKLDSPEYYSFRFDINVSSDASAMNESALGVPEVCIAGFHLDSNGELVEQVLKYPESE